MKRISTLIAGLVLAISGTTAQETTTASSWTKAGYAGLKFTQSSFTNWAQGGENALALDAQFTYQADYKNDKHLWQNRLELNYGFNQDRQCPAEKNYR